MTTAQRELRSDAQRNLARVLEAAREVFSEQGIDAPISEIARVAGVGVGTIFRRFPAKDDLLVALLEQRAQLLADAAYAASRSPDAGAAFRAFVEQAVGQELSDRCLCESIGTDLLARARIQERFDEVHGLLRTLLERAQADGAVRPDVTAEDLLFVFHGVARAGLLAEDVAPGAWRRFLALALDGLRPEAASRLPRRPLTKRQFRDARCGD